MTKAYWISAYRSINDTDALAAYAKLAGPSLTAAGGKFLARGIPAAAKENGQQEVTTATRTHLRQMPYWKQNEQVYESLRKELGL